MMEWLYELMQQQRDLNSETVSPDGAFLTEEDMKRLRFARYRILGRLARDREALPLHLLKYTIEKSSDKA